MGKKVIKKGKKFLPTSVKERRKLKKTMKTTKE